LLKEGLETHAASSEALCQWVNAIKNRQKEMDDTLAEQPQYWQPKNAMRNK
jgi:hypothetical protein